METFEELAVKFAGVAKKLSILSEVDWDKLPEEKIFKIDCMISDAMLIFIDTKKSAIARIRQEIEDGIKDANDPSVIELLTLFEEEIVELKQKHDEDKKPKLAFRNDIIAGINELAPKFLTMTETALQYGIDVSEFDELFEKYTRLKSKCNSNAGDQTMMNIRDDIIELNVILNEFLQFINRTEEKILSRISGETP